MELDGWGKSASANDAKPMNYIRESPLGCGFVMEFSISNMEFNTYKAGRVIYKFEGKSYAVAEPEEAQELASLLACFAHQSDCKCDQGENDSYKWEYSTDCGDESALFSLTIKSYGATVDLETYEADAIAKNIERILNACEIIEW